MRESTPRARLNPRHARPHTNVPQFLGCWDRPCGRAELEPPRRSPFRHSGARPFPAQCACVEVSANTHAQWRQGERRQRTLASQGAARSRKTARANAMSPAGRARERAAAHAATTTSPAPHTLCLAPPPRPSSFPSRDGKWGEGASSSFSFFLYPPAPPPPLSP